MGLSLSGLNLTDCGCLGAGGVEVVLWGVVGDAVAEQALVEDYSEGK